MSRPSRPIGAVSHNSFLNAKVRPSPESSRPPADKSINVSNLDQTDESPTTLTKTPTYEYYGFTLYLTSFIAFVIYLLWAYLPDETLISLGISYFPNRYWAIAWPVWTLVLIAFIYAVFFSINLMNTAPIDSFNTITDDYANVGQSLSRLSGITDDFVPGLHDIPIGVVNACLYQDLRGPWDEDEDEDP